MYRQLMVYLVKVGCPTPSSEDLPSNQDGGRRTTSGTDPVHVHSCVFFFKLPDPNQKTISLTVENSHGLLRRLNNKKNLELSAKQQICIFFPVLLSFKAVITVFSSLSLHKVGSEALVMFAERVTTALFGSQTKSTAGAQAYQIYSKHSSEKGQSAAAGMLIIRHSASRAVGRKREKKGEEKVR